MSKPRKPRDKVIDRYQGGSVNAFLLGNYVCLHEGSRSVDIYWRALPDTIDYLQRVYDWRKAQGDE